MKSDGTVSAWGRNRWSQLGNSMNTKSNVPVQVSKIIGVVAIAAGEYHSLALRSDGTLWGWGYNEYGQLGTGTSADGNVPVRVSNLTGVVAIAAGGKTEGVGAYEVTCHLTGI